MVLRERGTNKLKIILDAQLADVPGTFGSGRIQCQSYEKYNEATGVFEDSEGCAAGISVTQIENYVQGGRYQIEWGSE